MATKKQQLSRKSKTQSASSAVSTNVTQSARADEIFDQLFNSPVAEPVTLQPRPGLETKINNIYDQAHSHRNKLLHFFVWYTVAFSFFVLVLIYLQAYARAVLVGLEDIELVPQWAMYLLVVGMFGQLIGLLTIVTRKVWTFAPFFKHHNDSMHASDKS